MKERITENGIDYVLIGDYYYPEFTLPEESRPIGRFGRIHREYLKEHHRHLYSSLVLKCELWTYLADLNEQAEDRFDFIVDQFKKSEEVTEQLKEKDQMEWVCRMNNIRNRAEEVVLHELGSNEKLNSSSN